MALHNVRGIIIESGVTDVYPYIIIRTPPPDFKVFLIYIHVLDVVTRYQLSLNKYVELIIWITTGSNSDTLEA